MQILLFTGLYLPGFKGDDPIRTIANMVDQLGDEFNFALCTVDPDFRDDASYATVQPNVW